MTTKLADRKSLNVLTVGDLARRLEVHQLTIYRWCWKHGLPTLPAAVVEASRTHRAEKLLFSYDAVTKWLHDKRPELLMIWNGDSTAPITRTHAWTRKRLMEAASRVAA